MTKRIRNNFKFLKAKKEHELGRNVTYEEIQKVTGISPNTLSLYANAKVSMYSEETMLKLCDFFGCSLSELIEIVE